MGIYKCRNCGYRTDIKEEPDNKPDLIIKEVAKEEIKETKIKLTWFQKLWRKIQKK